MQITILLQVICNPHTPLLSTCREIDRYGHFKIRAPFLGVPSTWVQPAQDCSYSRSSSITICKSTNCTSVTLCFRILILLNLLRIFLTFRWVPSLELRIIALHRYLWQHPTTPFESHIKLSFFQLSVLLSLIHIGWSYHAWIHSYQRKMIWTWGHGQEDVDNFFKTRMHYWSVPVQTDQFMAWYVVKRHGVWDRHISNNMWCFRSILMGFSVPCPGTLLITILLLMNEQLYLK